MMFLLFPHEIPMKSHEIPAFWASFLVKSAPWNPGLPSSVATCDISKSPMDIKVAKAQSSATQFSAYAIVSNIYQLYGI